MPEAEALAKKLMAYPLSAIKLTKMAMTKAQDLPLNEGLDIEQWYMELSTQGEFKNFAQKFLAEKKAKGK